ncbi:unnamed protein product [Protopolystoma xenopodis]|uniref:Uncharacterized protein n=1 Tax=Protopolystoma xenopodis TaxID=117903 RepID=A0A3S5A776_9PLAT|nr:unnamed protein product [Protopolystoma xenopodis]
MPRNTDGMESSHLSRCLARVRQKPRARQHMAHLVSPEDDAFNSTEFYARKLNSQKSEIKCSTEVELRDPELAGKKIPSKSLVEFQVNGANRLTGWQNLTECECYLEREIQGRNVFKFKTKNQKVGILEATSFRRSVLSVVTRLRERRRHPRYRVSGPEKIVISPPNIEIKKEVKSVQLESEQTARTEFDRAIEIYELEKYRTIPRIHIELEQETGVTKANFSMKYG